MIHAGINTSEVATLIASAKRRIVFHATLYSRFAESPDMVSALHYTLERARGNVRFQGLHCISLDPATIPAREPVTSATGTDHAFPACGPKDAPGWANAFFSMLRPHATTEELVREFAVSHAFIEQLAGTYKGQVCHYITRSLPYAPLLIIDGLILCGHYLHGSVTAPEGFWFTLNAPVEFLFSCARTGNPPSDPQLRAAYRFITECQHAMHGNLCTPPAGTRPQHTHTSCTRDLCRAVQP